MRNPNPTVIADIVLASSAIPQNKQQVKANKAARSTVFKPCSARLYISHALATRNTGRAHNIVSLSSDDFDIRVWPVTFILLRKRAPNTLTEREPGINRYFSRKQKSGIGHFTIAPSAELAPAVARCSTLGATPR